MLDFDNKHWNDAHAKVLGAFSSKTGKGISQSWAQKELYKELDEVSGHAMTAKMAEKLLIC